MLLKKANTKVDITESSQCSKHVGIIVETNNIYFQRVYKHSSEIEWENVEQEKERRK